MPIERHDIADAQFEDSIIQMLLRNGFSPRRQGDLILLEGVGVGEGDHSVKLHLNLVEMDGHRILEVQSIIPTKPLTFDEAVLIAAHGNQSSLTVKFAPIENLSEQLHQINASIVLYADHLSEIELATMLYIFIKEVDAVDNELISISKDLKGSQ